MTVDSNPYKDFFQAEGTNPDIKTLQKDSIQVITFYEKSSTEFRITLDQLDKDLRDLSEAVENGNTEFIKLRIQLGYLQNGDLKDSQTTKTAKIFRQELSLSIPQVTNIVQIYSILRNIGSDNSARTPNLLSDIEIEFPQRIVAPTDPAAEDPQPRIARPLPRGDSIFPRIGETQDGVLSV